MKIPGFPLEITRKHLWVAGRQRVKTAGDLVGLLDDFSQLDRDRVAHLLRKGPSVDADDRYDRIKYLLGAAKIAGASAQYIAGTAAATALTNSQVAYMGPLVGLAQAPFVLGLHHVPVTSAATAATTITINANRTDTPAVIGGQAYLTATGDTAGRGPSFPFVVPFGIPAANGVSISGAETGAAGAVMTGSATLPMLLIVLGLS
jgi:hypothetical protein